jgi:molybdopterin/thiamine biosynthesis adenylyltransferase
MITDYRKQSELIVAEEFDKPIHVIGCGALGSWVAFILLKMGFRNVNVYDFDEVEEHNIPNQLFREKDIGVAKYEAMWRIYEDFFNDGNNNRLTAHNKRIAPASAKKLDGIVFCCVDSMEARKMIYENCYRDGKVELFIEGRIGLFGAFIYSLYEKNDDEFNGYEQSLYDDEEAEVSACGISQTALPSAINCASMMVMTMISWYRGNGTNFGIQYQIPDLLKFNVTY